MVSAQGLLLLKLLLERLVEKAKFSAFHASACSLGFPKCQMGHTLFHPGKITLRIGWTRSVSHPLPQLTPKASRGGWSWPGAHSLDEETESGKVTK